MPQITIEFSTNMAGRADIRDLARIVHDTARSTGLFNRGYGIRTRLCPREDYVIADGDPENAFVAIHLRIAHGRSGTDRERLAEAVFGAACAHLKTASETTPLALSLEVQEISPIGARNLNNLHERLAQKHGQA